ncbi:MAG: zinc ribbon domain-containing protein [Syntrophobacteraceae bacterium]|nr:zinc ribbon domain-containing protein [Syntrophobacteraceae bacterium]
MPIYEFRCAKCGHIQEFLFTSSSESAELTCPECQGDELERVLSQVSYSMGSSSSEKSASSPCATTRTCAPGKSCTTIQLPGHTR